MEELNSKCGFCYLPDCSECNPRTPSLEDFKFDTSKYIELPTTHPTIIRLKEENDKLKHILRHVTGLGPFICGIGGKDQDTNLPEVIFVCPAYGADVETTTAYHRNDIVKALKEIEWMYKDLDK